MSLREIHINRKEKEFIWEREGEENFKVSKRERNITELDWVNVRKKKGRETETETQTDRDTEIQRERERKTDKETNKEREREIFKKFHPHFK